MKLNKQLLKKVIERIETMPETYDQSHFVRQETKAACGTAACLAGEIVIASFNNPIEGVKSLRRTNAQDSGGWVDIADAPVAKRARKLLGIPKDVARKLFDVEGSYSGGDRYVTSTKWPQPFASEFKRGGQKRKARAAVNLLKAILRTDGKILETK